MNESLVKHIIPAFKVQKNKDEINILDICFGLGFNTLATLLYAKQNFSHAKINIYSPELDANLVKALGNFTYPKEFSEFKEILTQLVESGVYDNGLWHVEIFLGDAREYIKTFPHAKFDIVYQDAFSPSTNPLLWTKEYFRDIKKIIKNDGVVTTYSIALATRLALYENDFNIYINSGKDFRDATVASLSILDTFKKVDMKHKIACNPHAKPLMD